MAAHRHSSLLGLLALLAILALHTGSTWVQTMPRVVVLVRPREPLANALFLTQTAALLLQASPLPSLCHAPCLRAA